MRSHWANILVAAAVLAGVLAVSEFTELDMAVQAWFYSPPTHRWVIDKDEPVLRGVVYHGVKVLAVALGGGGAAVFVLSGFIPRLKRFRLAGLRVALALAIVPLSVSGLKEISNVYTPRQVTQFGGSKPHVKPFHRLPGSRSGLRRRGAGWPAGHACAGFSMMVIFYVLPGRRGRWAALAAANVLGWAGAIYQNLNGQHFVSHAMVSWLLAWILIHLIVMGTARGEGPPAPIRETASGTG
ncbi:MAG: phosphatase PAP2 family protein [Planctomycetota bacterium]|nr:phosphatase PAP2 family protein [Planctomycetota bacterium]